MFCFSYLNLITGENTFSLLLEFLFCGDGGVSQSSEEALHFLDRLLSTQHFLQVSCLDARPPYHLSPAIPLLSTHQWHPSQRVRLS